MAFQTSPEKTDQQLSRGVKIRWRCCDDIAGVPCIGEDLLNDGEFVGIQSRGRSVGRHFVNLSVGARVWRPLNGSARENCFLEKGLCAETIRVAIGEYVHPTQRPWRIERREPRRIDSDGSTLAK